MPDAQQKAGKQRDHQQGLADHQRQRFHVGNSRGDKGQKHEGDNDDQILNDQPAKRNVSRFGGKLAPVLQRLDGDRGARNRPGQSQNERGGNRPAKQLACAEADKRTGRNLQKRARHGDVPDTQQLSRRKMQADGEHQQRNADLGQFGCQFLIGGKSGRMRTDEDPRENIADDVRKPREPRQDAARISYGEADDDGGNERRSVADHGDI